MIKQISLLSLGGVIVTLLQLLLYPIFAYRTGSELLGDYGYILSLIQTVSIVILLNTQLLIRVEKHQKAIDKAANLGVTLLLLFSVPIGLLFFNYPIEIKFINILMFTCFGIKHLSLSVLYNEEKYTIITLVNILGKTLALALLISITYLDNIRLMHLLLVTLLSEIIAIATILLNISKNSFRPRVSFNAELFKKQRDIVGYKSAQDLINKLGGQLPIIFARNFVDTATAGNYFIALKMVQSPLSIISKSIRDVVFVEYGKLKSSVGNTFTRNFIMIHLLVFVAIYSVLWIFSDLLANILSNEWLLSAKLLFYIIPILLSNSLASVFRDNLLILKRGRFVLKLDTVFGVFRVMTFVICWKYDIDFKLYLLVLAILTPIFNIFTVFKWKYFYS